MWLIVRRLVWLDCATGAAFRVVEDRSFADRSDEPFELGPGATVRQAHPALLGDDIATWHQIFDDYELLQPFSQLDRPVAVGAVEGFVDAQVAAGVLGPLGGRGWRLAGVRSSSVYRHVERTVGDLTVVLEIDPGVKEFDLRAAGVQTLRDAYVHDGPAGRWGAKEERLPIAVLDAGARSELLADLAEICDPPAGP